MRKLAVCHEYYSNFPPTNLYHYMVPHEFETLLKNIHFYTTFEMEASQFGYNEKARLARAGLVITSIFIGRTYGTPKRTWELRGAHRFS